MAAVAALLQQYNSSGALRQELGDICIFLRFSTTFRRGARTVPGRAFLYPLLAKLGLVGGCVAGDTESRCVGSTGRFALVLIFDHSPCVSSYSCQTLEGDSAAVLVLNLTIHCTSNRIAAVLSS